MATRSLITGLDIGTKTIKVLVVRKTPKEGVMELVSLAEGPAEGISQRGVGNSEQLSQSILTVIHQAEQESSFKIKEVNLNIGGSRFRAVSTHSLISVSRADREISQEDINRVLQAAKIINLPSNYEVWGVVPKEFIVDEQKGIQNPLGMKGTRLEVEALLLTVFTPYREKIEKAVTKAGLEINDTLISSLAAAEAVLTPQQKEKGVAVADIGSGLTKVAVFKNGSLIWTSISSLGSENITDDLGVSFQVDPAQAEEMKTTLKLSLDVSQNKKKKTTSREREIVKIVKPRVEDILEEINKQVSSACARQDLPAGVVFTGGGAKLKGIESLAKKEFKLPVSLGYCSSVVGLEKDLSLATVAGLVLMAKDEGLKSRGGFLTLLKRLLRILNP